MELHGYTPKITYITAVLIKEHENIQCGATITRQNGFFKASMYYLICVDHALERGSPTFRQSSLRFMILFSDL